MNYYPDTNSYFTGEECRYDIADLDILEVSTYLNNSFMNTEVALYDLSELVRQCKLIGASEKLDIISNEVNKLRRSYGSIYKMLFELTYLPSDIVISTDGTNSV